jgi:hypothetical protein
MWRLLCENLDQSPQQVEECRPDTSWIQADTSGYIADTRDTKAFLYFGIIKLRISKVYASVLFADIIF